MFFWRYCFIMNLDEEMVSSPSHTQVEHFLLRKRMFWSDNACSSGSFNELFEAILNEFRDNLFHQNFLHSSKHLQIRTGILAQSFRTKSCYLFIYSSCSVILNIYPVNYSYTIGKFLSFHEFFRYFFQSLSCQGNF